MKTSWRLRFFVACLRWLQFSSVRVTGLEYILSLPAGTRVIVATSHLTDCDVPVALSVLARYLPLKLVDQSIHHKWSGEGQMYLSLLLAGKGNFLPLTVQGRGRQKVGVFRTNDFAHMIAVLRVGWAVLIAGENPSYDQLPPRPGWGAMYLAQQANAVVLPVAVKIDAPVTTSGWKMLWRRPAATIIVGQHFSPPAINAITRRRAFHALRHQAEDLQSRLRSLGNY